MLAAAGESTAFRDAVTCVYAPGAALRDECVADDDVGSACIELKEARPGTSAGSCGDSQPTDLSARANSMSICTLIG